MKLIVITGQEGADADGLLRQVIADKGYSYSEAPRMVFPERSNLLYHPRSLYNNVKVTWNTVRRFPNSLAEWRACAIKERRDNRQASIWWLFHIISWICWIV